MDIDYEYNVRDLNLDPQLDNLDKLFSLNEVNSIDFFGGQISFF